jgi:hypothetical protein
MRKTLVLFGIALFPFVRPAHAAPTQQAGPHQRAHLRFDQIGWPGYARDQAHNAASPNASQPLHAIHWQTPVDLNPQYSSGELLIHYGTPVITPNGTIIVTVKVGANGSFKVEGHQAGTGALMWSQTTDWIVPNHNWVPSCGSTLTPQNVLATPGAGGTIYLRANPDSVSGTVTQAAFYGIANYTANPSSFNNHVLINTPITSDAQGNLYFGFMTVGTPLLGLQGGIARISSAGVGSWVAAHTAANDIGIQRVQFNCAPALSPDGTKLYVAVTDQSTSGAGHGYLLELDSTTLNQLGRVRLKDVRNASSDAYVDDDGTSSPCVGPDGDVYFGVLENPFGSNNSRGWMLHFNASLTQTKIPGAFGWDDTASIVPASAVPSYSGPSSYLVLTKYNNYCGSGTGNGHNKVGILDPNVSFTEPVSGQITMKEIITVMGPTGDVGCSGAVKEWCINTAAVDPATKSALVNNEDGKLYRWSFVTNTLTETMTLTSGLGEAYTPTLVGPDGVVYAVNNAILFAVGN